jgi:hypothetical protein
MSTRQTLKKKINDMTLAALEAMTDEQLQAMADQDPHDLTGFSDQELDSIKNGTASRELMRRVELAKITAEKKDLS